MIYMKKITINSSLKLSGNDDNLNLLFFKSNNEGKDENDD